MEHQRKPVWCDVTQPIPEVLPEVVGVRQQVCPEVVRPGALTTVVACYAVWLTIRLLSWDMVCGYGNLMQRFTNSIDSGYFRIQINPSNADVVGFLTGIRCSTIFPKYLHCSSKLAIFEWCTCTIPCLACDDSHFRRFPNVGNKQLHR